MITQALLRWWYLTTVATHDGTKYQVMIRFDGLSADEKISQLPPELESSWSSLVGSNWKPKISLFSMPKNSNKKLEWDLK